MAAIIRQPEGRRLEFKETLPTSADLAKTFVAFANDAGGELFIGIRNEPREVVGPGKLLPSIDFNDMEARQSDIRNKIIAPVFKKLGLIDQWGNGLKLIFDELKEYPDIEFKWFEKGL